MTAIKGTGGMASGDALTGDTTPQLAKGAFGWRTLSGVDIAGNQLPTAPRFSASGGVDIDLMDNGHGKVVVGADTSYVSRQYFELFNEDILAQAPYALVNARLSYRTSDGRYGVSAWAKNLTDKFYRTAAIDATGLGFLYFHIGEPRTYGLTLDAKF